MTNKKKKQIFIAYNHMDKVVARLIYWALIQEPWNVEVFLDEFSISPGENILQECLQKAKAADLGLIVLSTHTLESKYVPQEIGVLISRNIPIIFVATHENCSVPPGFAEHVRSFPLYEDKNPLDGIRRLILVIRELLKPQEKGAIELLNKASKLANQGKFDEALQYVERAIEVDPYYDNAYLAKIRNLRRLRRYTEALDTANKALVMFPEHPTLYYYRGFLFLSMGKLIEALEDFNTVLKLTEEQDQNALFFKGLCLEKLGKIDDAIHVYDAAYKIARTTVRGRESLHRKSMLKARKETSNNAR